MKSRSLSCALALILLCSANGEGGVTSKLLREGVEFVGKKSVREAAETLSQRAARLAARYGDDAATAVGRVGPRAIQLADDAAEHAPLVLKLLARHGDTATRLVSRPQQLKMLAEVGEDAIEAALKHGDAAVPLIERYGASAAKALVGLSPQSGRRMAILAADGTLAKLSRADELLGIVGRYGDKGCDWLWRNKGALAVGTSLAAFLAEPEAFIDGGARLAGVVADSTVKPVVTAAAATVSWSLSLLVTGIFAGIILLAGWSAWRNPKLLRAAAEAIRKRVRPPSL